MSSHTQPMQVHRNAKYNEVEMGKAGSPVHYLGICSLQGCEANYRFPQPFVQSPTDLP